MGMFMQYTYFVLWIIKWIYVVSIFDNYIVLFFGEKCVLCVVNQVYITDALNL